VLLNRQLSGHALAALAEFNAEKDAHQKRFERLKAEAEANADAGDPLSMDAFTEDWNESQFWVGSPAAADLCGRRFRSFLMQA
jgi:hypothetical protein